MRAAHPRRLRHLRKIRSEFEDGEKIFLNSNVLRINLKVTEKSFIFQWGKGNKGWLVVLVEIYNER